MLEDLAGLRLVFLPIDGVGEQLEGLSVVGQFGHLEADGLSFFIFDEGARGENIVGEGHSHEFVQLDFLLGVGVMVEFNGRIS